MPKFVPVADPEAPRWEQDESKLAKHRAWDGFVIARDSTEQRRLAASGGGTDGGSGWGHVGKHGPQNRVGVLAFRVPIWTSLCSWGVRGLLFVS